MGVRPRGLGLLNKARVSTQPRLAGFELSHDGQLETPAGSLAGVWRTRDVGNLGGPVDVNEAACWCCGTAVVLVADEMDETMARPIAASVATEKLSNQGPTRGDEAQSMLCNVARTSLGGEDGEGFQPDEEKRSPMPKTRRWTSKVRSTKDWG